MKVFIGSEPSQARAERVLLRSIAETSPTAEPVVMRAGDKGWCCDGVTGFTMFRWCIPELMGFKGFAIYLDCDMLVLRDLDELFEFRKPGRWVQHGSEQGDCVSVIDCAAMPDRWPKAQAIRSMHKSTMRRMLERIIDPGVPDLWNCCDELRSDTALIHFTSIQTQPWTEGRSDHPDQRAVTLWDSHEIERL